MLFERTKNDYEAPSMMVSLLSTAGLLCASDWNSGSIDPDDVNDLGSY